jgi:hypothetical protein
MIRENRVFTPYLLRAGARDGWPSAKQWVVPGSREVGW